jgi:hypothetical protein
MLASTGCAFLFNEDAVEKPDGSTDPATDETDMDAVGDPTDPADDDVAGDADTTTDPDAPIDSPVDIDDEDPSNDLVEDTSPDGPDDTIGDTPLDTGIDPIEDLYDTTDPPEDTAFDDFDAGPAVLLGSFDLITDSNGDTVPDDAPLLITELMINPSAVVDSQGEFAEVLNVSTNNIDIIGLAVSDNVNTFTIASSTILPPGGYLLFGVTLSPGANYGVPTGSPDFVYFEANFSLSNTSSDWVELSHGGTTIHRVTYYTGSAPTTLTNIDQAPVEARSFNLDSSFLSGADAATWCLTPASIAYAYNTVSTLTDYGSPGHANYDCP